MFEPAISKIKSLKFATEAAITILRIDDLIKLEPEKGEESAYQQAYQSGQLDGYFFLSILCLFFDTLHYYFKI